VGLTRFLVVDASISSLVAVSVGLAGSRFGTITTEMEVQVRENDPPAGDNGPNGDGERQPDRQWHAGRTIVALTALTAVAELICRIIDLVVR
jgi:hypothetical protein